MTTVPTNKKYYVVFYSPGTLVAETSTREIDAWDIKKACQLAMTVEERHGATPYGFHFEIRVVANDIDDGFGGKLKVQPSVVEKSGMYYINGVIETLEQIKARRTKKEDVLISNMESNGWDRVVTVTNRYRWTQPFEKGDHVVDSDGRIIL